MDDYISHIAFLAESAHRGVSAKDLPAVTVPATGIDYVVIFDDLHDIWAKRSYRRTVKEIYRSTVWNPRYSKSKQLVEISRYLSTSLRAGLNVFHRANDILATNTRISKHNLVIIQHYMHIAGRIWSNAITDMYVSYEQMSGFFSFYQSFYEKYGGGDDDTEKHIMAYNNYIGANLIKSPPIGSSLAGAGNSLRLINDDPIM